MPDRYTSSGDGTEANQYTITNRYTPEETSVNVNKVWEDNNDQDGIRPDSIQVQLVKEVGGQKTELEDKIITLSEDNEWTGTFDNLPAYENGQKITYTVKEITVDGYDVEITSTEENNFTITNTYTPDVTSITAKKQWVDFDDRDGIRPDSVEFELYKNGESTGIIKELTADDWTATFDNLPVKENGEEIVYTVREIHVPEGYYPVGARVPVREVNGEIQEQLVETTEGTKENGYTITNIHKIFDLSLRKYITKVGDTDITDRTPNIDVNPLIEGYMRRR